MDKGSTLLTAWRRARGDFAWFRFLAAAGILVGRAAYSEDSTASTLHQWAAPMTPYQKAVEFAELPEEQGGMALSHRSAEDWARHYLQGDPAGTQLDRRMERYREDYEFAVTPIKEGGLGLRPSLSASWAEGRNIYAPSGDEGRTRDAYRRALRFAVMPVAQGGLGKTDLEARNWAWPRQAMLPGVVVPEAELLDQPNIRDPYQFRGWRENYRLAFEYAQLPEEKGGLGKSAEAASRYALRMEYHPRDRYRHYDYAASRSPIVSYDELRQAIRTRLEQRIQGSTGERRAVPLILPPWALSRNKPRLDVQSEVERSNHYDIRDSRAGSFEAFKENVRLFAVRPIRPEGGLGLSPGEASAWVENRGWRPIGLVLNADDEEAALQLWTRRFRRALAGSAEVTREQAMAEADELAFQDLRKSFFEQTEMNARLLAQGRKRSNKMNAILRNCGKTGAGGAS